MMGDYHVRFCERLAGETPACLLGLVRSAHYETKKIFKLFFHFEQDFLK